MCSPAGTGPIAMPTTWAISSPTTVSPYCGPDQTNSNYLTSMIPFDTTIPLYPDNSPSYHDNGTDATNDVSNKQLLSYPGAANGGVLVNGGTGASDLQFALDNIFNHPNVGPFIAKQLIQRLVTSNPSPAYVQRVATVFNNDGTGARGNLKAVVKQILLDPEARFGQWQNPDTFGKLREPLLTLTHFGARWARSTRAVEHSGQRHAGNGRLYLSEQLRRPAVSLCRLQHGVVDGCDDVVRRRRRSGVAGCVDGLQFLQARLPAARRNDDAQSARSGIPDRHRQHRRGHQQYVRIQRLLRQLRLAPTHATPTIRSATCA